MSTFLKILLPYIVVAAGAGGAFFFFITREEAEVVRPDPVVPLVRAITVAKVDRRLVVESEGTVRPVTQSTLVPEVSGRVVRVADSWADGGFFAKDDVLLEIDPTDYRFALEEAKARVADAELALAREEEEAQIAQSEWQELEGDTEPPALVRREPQLARARANIEAARSAVDRAKLDLERTRVIAPYAGRIRRKNVDIGQYVTRGAAVAEIYSVEKAEVRLPVADRELAFVDLPLRYRGDAGVADGPAEFPEVTLRASFAGREFAWKGTIVRTEGEIDPRSRRVHAVAEVLDPYGRAGEPGRPPLAVGLFVHAAIHGKLIHDVVVLPRHALRAGHQVLVIDDESRLRFREVDVLRTHGEEVVVQGGLEADELVCISPLDVVVEGMPVEVENGDSGPDATEGES